MTNLNLDNFKNKWVRAPNGVYYYTFNISDSLYPEMYRLNTKTYVCITKQELASCYILDEMEEELLGVNGLFKLTEDKIGYTFPELHSFNLYKLLDYSNKDKVGIVKRVSQIPDLIYNNPVAQTSTDDKFLTVNELGEVFDETNFVTRLKIL